jgi:hypothetical protein
VLQYFEISNTVFCVERVKFIQLVQNTFLESTRDTRRITKGKKNYCFPKKLV